MRLTDFYKIILITNFEDNCNLVLFVFLRHTLQTLIIFRHVFIYIKKFSLLNPQYVKTKRVFKNNQNDPILY